MKEIDLHERAFVDETISDAKLIFRGQAVSMVNATMDGCTFTFAGEAATTLVFLEAMYRMSGQGALLVEELFEAIRAGKVSESRLLQ